MPEAGKRKRNRGHRAPAGALPGTLFADPSAQPTRLALTLIAPDKCKTIRKASLADVVANADRWPLIWLDCVGLGDVELIGEIGKVFGLHPLALEDVLSAGLQRPKVDFFDDHAFVVLRMIDDAELHRYEQVCVFFGEKFVITFQERKGDPFDPVRRRVESAEPSRLRGRGADYLAYTLIDAVVDSYFGPIEGLSDAVEGVEEEMLRAPLQEQMQILHRMRRQVLVLKGVLWPLRDALAALVRSEERFVAVETKVFLNDTLDHAFRLIELVETQRDTLTGLMEMHLSLSQARTNDIISLLTIVSTIFIPLTFLVGVWGMNFDPDTSPWNMPELRAYYGYPAALVFMLVVAVALFGYFKWKKWL